MSLIFDRFPSTEHAAMFAGAVERAEPELEVLCYSTVAQAQAHDPFPGELAPPIVHVERIDTADDHTIERYRELGGGDTLRTGAERELALEELVTSYGGRFAGT